MAQHPNGKLDEVRYRWPWCAKPTLELVVLLSKAVGEYVQYHTALPEAVKRAGEGPDRDYGVGHALKLLPSRDTISRDHAEKLLIQLKRNLDVETAMREAEKVLRDDAYADIPIDRNTRGKAFEELPVVWEHIRKMHGTRELAKTRLLQAVAAKLDYVAHFAPSLMRIYPESDVLVRGERAKVGVEYTVGGNFVVVQSVVSRGSFGQVFRGYDLTTGMDIAVKEVVKVTSVKALEQEIAVHRMLNHRNIVQMLDCFDRRKIVMEFCSGGTLEALVRRKSPFSSAACKAIFRQLSEAVAYMHNLNLMHRDIKPENILLAYPVETPEEAVIKLSDFGLAKLLKEDEMTATVLGSYGFIAPEILDKIFDPTSPPYTKPADMWSMGVVLFSISTAGAFPFGITNIFDHRHTRQCMDTALTFPSCMASPDWIGGKDLVSSLLVLNPAQRLTADEILANPWVPPLPSPSLEEEYTAVDSIILHPTDEDVGPPLETLSGSPLECLTFAVLVAIVDYIDPISPHSAYSPLVDIALAAPFLARVVRSGELWARHFARSVGRVPRVVQQGTPPPNLSFYHLFRVALLPVHCQLCGEAFSFRAPEQCKAHFGKRYMRTPKDRWLPDTVLEDCCNRNSSEECGVPHTHVAFIDAMASQKSLLTSIGRNIRTFLASIVAMGSIQSIHLANGAASLIFKLGSIPIPALQSMMFSEGPFAFAAQAAPDRIYLEGNDKASWSVLTAAGTESDPPPPP